MRSLILPLAVTLGLIFQPTFATALESTPAEYRALVSRIRQKGTFRAPVPNHEDFSFKYDLRIGEPLFTLPIVSDFYLDPFGTKWVRKFFDKIFVKDGAVLSVGGEQVPLTCIFVEGQDNRFSQKDTPLIPDFVLRVYLVANDFTCTGPINPGWPGNGGKKETWDTYVYYEIRDPTIMLPVEARIRYRWNEFQAMIVDSGGGP